MHSINHMDVAWSLFSAEFCSPIPMLLSQMWGVYNLNFLTAVRVDMMLLPWSFV